jgi:hypothetical protein
MRPSALVALLVALLTASLAATSASAKQRKRKKSSAEVDESYATAPSYRYGMLGADACVEELERRGIVFTRVEEAPGVLAPVRIPDGVGGVTFRTALPRDKAAESPWEVFDCRLVLALHDFAAILGGYGIDAVEIYSAWRPPPKRWPKGKLATRHPGALAVDVARFGKLVPADREEDAPRRLWISVQKSWHGSIGAVTCGDRASPPRKKVAEAKELRAIVCKAASERLFTTILTPNHDRAHYNHFHLEVTPEVTWRMVR